jgi:hypothetical protein
LEKEEAAKVGQPRFAPLSFRQSSASKRSC